MYTRHEESKQKQAFWTAFGQYMQPVLSADGRKTNWVNYKTGIPGINFRMDADGREATISIVLSHSDAYMQQSHYGQLLQLKSLLHNFLEEEWQWQQPVANDSGKTTGRIGTTLANINISRREDWPQLISFFKPRIIALDKFWAEVKYGFE